MFTGRSEPPTKEKTLVECLQDLRRRCDEENARYVITALWGFSAEEADVEIARMNAERDVDLRSSA